MWSEPPSKRTPAHPQNEEYGPVAMQNHLTLVEGSGGERFAGHGTPVCHLLKSLRSAYFVLKPQQRLDVLHHEVHMLI